MSEPIRVLHAFAVISFRIRPILRCWKKLCLRSDRKYTKILNRDWCFHDLNINICRAVWKYTRFFLRRKDSKFCFILLYFKHVGPRPITEHSSNATWMLLFPMSHLAWKWCHLRFRQHRYSKTVHVFYRSDLQVLNLRICSRALVQGQTPTSSNLLAYCSPLMLC